MEHCIMDYHIEGLDLAGKSTVTEALYGILLPEVVLRRNTLLPDNAFHKEVDQMRLDNSIDSKSLGWLYVDVLENDLKHFQWPECNYIQDSTLLIRSLAYHTAKENHDITSKLWSLVEFHPKFSRSIVLTASIEKRVERLEMRRQNNPNEVAEDDLLVIKNPNLFLEMEHNLVSFSQQIFDSVLLDTSLLSRDEVFSAVQNIFFA